MAFCHEVSPFLSQSNFRKAGYGLCWLAEVGMEKCVMGIERLEMNSGGKLTIGVFKGAETLIQPDVMTLFFILAFFKQEWP